MIFVISLTALYTSAQQKEQAPRGSVEITSDLHGFNISKPIAAFISKVKGNWYANIPENALFPVLKTGHAVIDFRANRDGSLDTFSITRSTGDESMDKAAVDAIKSTAPFHLVPDDFPESYIGLRFFFTYCGQSKCAPQ